MTDPRSPGNQLDENALHYHRYPRPGKLEIRPTKPLGNQRDLALAYTPGVAEPCRAIAADPATAMDYTARGNLVAVITNGTAEEFGQICAFFCSEHAGYLTGQNIPVDGGLYTSAF